MTKSECRNKHEARMPTTRSVAQFSLSPALDSPTSTRTIAGERAGVRGPERTFNHRAAGFRENDE
jgi:hypothetical protein